MRLGSMLLLAAGFGSMGAHAQVPSGATSVCSDGSYSQAKTQARACAKHGGVKTWMGGTQVAAPVPVSSPKASSPAAKSASGATAMCSDGSYSEAKTQARACSKHGGVKTWMGAATKTTAVVAPIPAPMPMPRTNGSAANAPAGTTAVCTDGSFSRAQTQARACLKHGGIKTWAATSTTTQPNMPIGSGKPVAIPAPTVPTVPQPAPVNRLPTTAPPVARAPTAPKSAPVLGGGNGLVWVNKSTKVFHCQGDRWYGRTKSGEYMTQAAALAKGDHPEHGKRCP